MNNSVKKLLVGTVGAASLFMASASVDAATTHKVAANDTVWDLSQKYGVSIKSIEKLNHIDTNSHLITVGQNLNISGNQSKQATPAKQSTSTQAKSTYTVKAGDSLYTIAQNTGVSVAALRQANNLTGSALQIGQKLQVNGSVKVANVQSQPAVAEQSNQAQVTLQNQTQSATRTQGQSAQSQSQAVTNNYSAQANNQTQSNNGGNSQAANYNNNGTQNNQSYTRSQSTQNYTRSQAQPQTRATNNNAGSANYGSVVGYANTFTGSNYVYGGTTPAGFDCSGFTQYVFNKYGKKLPRTSQAQANAGTRISTSQAKPGDLIITNGGSHVGIYTGNNSFISAQNPNDGVRTSNLKYWGDSYAVRVR